ncbi:MAG TPA: hypothetical protein VD999_07770 [Vitreimonas sp.]|nr:hypothetical protein [Vitreimonas sp.]
MSTGSEVGQPLPPEEFAKVLERYPPFTLHRPTRPPQVFARGHRIETNDDGLLVILEVGNPPTRETDTLKFVIREWDELEYETT